MTTTSASKSTVAVAFYHRPWIRMMGIVAITFVLGWSLGVFRGEAVEGSLDAREWQISTRRLEQQVSSLQAQLVDYEALQKVQQDMIAQLKTGNEKLQNRLYEIQEDVKVFQQN